MQHSSEEIQASERSLVMDSNPESKPAVLVYGTVADKSGWPVGIYIGALVWAFLTLSVFTPALDGRENNAARGRGQVTLLACALLRLAWALHRREKNRGWIFYVILLFLAAPIWILVEEPLWAVGRALWGRGLSP